MGQIPDGSIDMVLCDLPYGTTRCSWDIVIPFEYLWAHYNRVVKRNGPVVLFGSQPFTTLLIYSNIKAFRYEWIWHKNFSGGFANAKIQPMKYHENVLVFYRGKVLYNPQFEAYAESVQRCFKEGGIATAGKSNIHAPGFGGGPCPISFKRGRYPSSVQKISGVPNSNGTRVHPSQKPVELCEYLIKTYTNEGDLVLDNCAGSGTTGVAYKNLGRNFILIEKERRYCEIAYTRIFGLKKKTLKT